MVESMDWTITAVNTEMIRDFVDHIVFRFSSDGIIHNLLLYLVFEKSKLIENVIWIDLGLMELTSTCYRHGEFS